MSDFTIFARTTTPKDVVNITELYIMSMFPDILMTGPNTLQYPIPYSVFSKLENAVDTPMSVRSSKGGVIMTKTSFVPYTEGGELGTGGGVKSCTEGGPSKQLFWPCSQSVRAEGKNIVRVFDLYNMNNGNTIGWVSPKNQNVIGAIGDTSQAVIESFENMLGDFFRSMTMPMVRPGGHRGPIETVGDCLSEHNFATRGIGLIKLIVGGTEFVAGAIAFETGVGIGVAIVGIDDLNAGLGQLWTGEEQDTYRSQLAEQVARELGVDEENVYLVGDATDLVTSAGVSGALGEVNSVDDLAKWGFDELMRQQMGELASDIDADNINGNSIMWDLPDPYLDTLRAQYESNNESVESQASKIWDNPAIGKCAIIEVATPEHNVHVSA